MKQELTEKEVNRLAQRFYEASEVSLTRMTDKPAIVEGLRVVLQEIGVVILPDPPTAEEAMLQIKDIFYDGAHKPAVIRMNDIYKIFRNWEQGREVGHGTN